MAKEVDKSLVQVAQLDDVSHIELGFPMDFLHGEIFERIHRDYRNCHLKAAMQNAKRLHLAREKTAIPEVFLQ